MGGWRIWWRRCEGRERLDIVQLCQERERERWRGGGEGAVLFQDNEKSIHMYGGLTLYTL